MRLRLEEETSYPLDWEMVDRHAPDFYDTSAPHSDWSRHVRDDVEARAVPVPADLITPLDQVAQRLERLTDDEPLAAIRVMAMLEHIVKDTAPLAAQLAQADAEEDGTDIGRGLARSTSRPHDHVPRVRVRVLGGVDVVLDTLAGTPSPAARGPRRPGPRGVHRRQPRALEPARRVGRHRDLPLPLLSPGGRSSTPSAAWSTGANSVR